MAVRIDLEAHTVRCSVHDVLPETVPSRPWREGPSRLGVGAELHRIVQGQRRAEDAAYLPEAPVDATLEVDGWRLRIVGRVDGLYRPDHGRPVVEEIKTLHFRSELHHLFAHERIERFRWQVRIYAFCLFPAGDAHARLLLVDLGGAEHRLEEVAWTPAQVQAFLRARLHALVAAERERQKTLARWRTAADELVFPFPEVRPVQAEAVEAIEESLASGRHLLLAAPTGVGKTAAALFPAVRLALASGRRLVFATAKTLQQHLAVETLQAMHDGSWRSLQLRAKARMCAHREVICHEEFCPFLADMWPRLAERGVVEALLDHGPHLDPDRVFDLARAAEVCPFETSLALIPHASAVICDYNYVFDPTIALFGTPDDGGLEDTYLVVDEAHNLVDRSREYYSPRLARSTVQAARALVEGYRQRVCRELEEVMADLEQLVAGGVQRAVGRAVGTRRTELAAERLVEIRLALDALLVPYFNFKRQAEVWLAQDPVMEVSLTLSRLVALLADGGRELVPLAERTAGPQGDEAVRILCLDASRFVGRLLASSAGTVAMSATLQPFEFFRDLLGFEPDRTDTLALPSPFPREHRLVVTVSEVDTTYSQRARYYGRIAELIGELAPPGRNALVLFPSYAFLNEVASRLHLPDHQLEIQRGDHSEALRRDILARMRANHTPTVLLAVLGGVFAEGVDYPGEMLSEVVVVSPALPQVGPERELLKEYFQDRFERGFEYAYLVPGMTRVVQAAGRLIRSDQDRGAIVLVCRRFAREPYTGLLPQDWLEDASGECADPAARVREFFAAMAAPERQEPKRRRRAARAAARTEN
ncbi:MAG TPA: ATP-dependent DNA helicase [Thermoanaerobaculaceae bacterium]|nr:ATP-dependent DNA helicase [Thermoanaerobaculaceae bacterium]HRS16690.1 ATP-dependent DNA helicase [Thermoanaerobaculaceae bacterium]